jgi:hypothetical protein
MADREYTTDAERKAYLAGVEDTAKKLQGEPLSLAEVRQMTPQQIIARKAEVDEVMRRGPDAEKGGGDDENEE